MFWVDKIVEEIERDYSDEIKAGTPLILRDEKTLSGRVHIGSVRGVAIHSIVRTALKEKGIEAKFLFEFNDFDPMDGLPVYLDEKEYKEYMGMPLYKVPSPDGEAKNFAEYFGQEFMDVIERSGFAVDEIPRASELYLSGSMNEVIKTALENADEIREIYKRVSKSEKDADWLPLNVICEKCGKVGTTKVSNFDGEKVSYTCKKDLVEWAEGCGHEGKVSPYNGNAKLPWKVEWAAKFKVYGVHIEGAGKDHSTKGGSRDIARNIVEKIFEYKNPFDIPYEFLLIGGKKMASSKGLGASSKEIADLVPPHIFRLTMLGKQPKRTVEFTPDGDTIPLLFDRYDQIAEKYYGGVGDDDARLFEMLHVGEKIDERFLPRFSQIAFLSQIPSVNIEEHTRELKGSDLTEADLAELKERVVYAKNWIDTFTPEDYMFEIQESVPESAKSFSDLQKKAIKAVADFIESKEKIDGQELHTTLHDIRKETDIDAKEYFSAIYLSLLGKESGPKAGFFLSVLDRDFLLKRFREVSE